MMESRIEKTWTRWEKETEIVDDVARIASRSLRNDRRILESSIDGGGFDLSTFSAFIGAVAAPRAEDGSAAGGFLVASSEALVGSESNAASKFLE